MENFLQISMWMRSKGTLDLDLLVGYLSLVYLDIGQVLHLSQMEKTFLFIAENLDIEVLLSLQAKTMSFSKNFDFSKEKCLNLWCHVLMSKTVFA